MPKHKHLCSTKNTHSVMAFNELHFVWEFIRLAHYVIWLFDPLYISEAKLVLLFPQFSMQKSSNFISWYLVMYPISTHVLIK